MSILNKIPQALLEDIVAGKCIPIIGAGFSRNAILPPNKEMPDWNKLGKEIADLIPNYPYSTPLDAISAYSHEYSRVKLIEKLTELLNISLAKPGSTHKAFSNLPFDIVCTTNFDFLLEKSYDMGTTPVYCHSIIGQEQLSISTPKQGVSLLKLHGDLNHPDRLVVTEEDYDSFLNRYPILATYFGNLLITRTPLLIGYSLEDPDFRQIWQIIGDRLGKMRRNAYVITVGAKKHEIGRYERRGVNVINLPGSKSQFGLKLEELFKELRDYWPQQLLKNSLFDDESSLDGLLMPKDSTNRLCYFAIPNSLKSFYKSAVFPIARHFGFVPLTSESILSPGDNIIAKITALLDKAQLVIIDLSNGKMISELNMAISRKLNPPKILVILDEGFELPIESKNLTILYKTNDLVSFPSDFIDEIEKWFSSESEELRPHFFEEPNRLLNKKEYNSAVISAINSLEITLKEALSHCAVNLRNEKKEYQFSLIRMSELAVVCGLINEDDLKLIKSAANTRNKVVHTEMTIHPDEYKVLVENLMKIIQKLRNHTRNNLH